MSYRVLNEKFQVEWRLQERTQVRLSISYAYLSSSTTCESIRKKVYEAEIRRTGMLNPKSKHLHWSFE